jgi:hypothetical protein
MTTGGRSARDLAPVSALPQWYFAVAHVAFASALGVLLVDPELAAGTFNHPKVIALVHLLTVGWLTGSILGAFYIVAPLAIGMPMRVTAIDWVGFGCFAAGAAGMVSHFWIATYDGMAWSAILVVAAVGLVGGRAARRAHGTTVAVPVWLHLGLAFFNFMAAAGFGILIGFDKSRGTLGLSSMTATYAHAHLAAVGWVLLMVIGMAYRLIPMMLPAAIPAGRALYVSALAIEAGLAVLFIALLGGGGLLPAGAALIACGIVSFVLQVRGILKTRKPRPPALPRPDWSTRQTHVALMWLLVALGCGLALTVTEYGESHTTVAWVYGVAGLVGFLAQMVSGVQGRIVPWYAWYRAQEALAGQTPAIAANALPSAAHARATFAGWTIGVPALAAGLAGGHHVLVRLGALCLLAGVVTGALHMRHMLRRALAIHAIFRPSAVPGEGQQ